MLERRKIGVEKMKNENGVDLKSGEEIERAFRNRLERTFRISEEENLVRGMKEWWMSGSDRAEKEGRGSRKGKFLVREFLKGSGLNQSCSRDLSNQSL